MGQKLQDFMHSSHDSTGAVPDDLHRESRLVRKLYIVKTCLWTAFVFRGVDGNWHFETCFSHVCELPIDQDSLTHNS